MLSLGIIPLAFGDLIGLEVVDLSRTRLKGKNIKLGLIPTSERSSKGHYEGEFATKRGGDNIMPQ